MGESLVQNFHQNNRGTVEAGAPYVDKDFASLIKEATEVTPSSFEFCVWSDKGINLHVDLNSSPSDWTNRFRNEVQVRETMYGNKSWSLRQDLACLGGSATQERCSLWDANPVQIDAHNGLAKSSSSLKFTKDSVVKLDQRNEVKSPLISDSVTPCSMNVKAAANSKEVNQCSALAEPDVNVVNNLMQDQSTLSAEESYGVPSNFIFGAESCAKDASKAFFYSDATGTPFKSLCDSVGNSLSDLGTLAYQSSKPDDECFQDCDLLNDSCCVNPGVVCPGASLSSSMELQISEAASCHKYPSVSLCENDGSLDLSEPKNTSDTEQCGPAIDGNNFAALTEEWVGMSVDGRESSECSQLDDRVQKSGQGYDDQGSKMKLCKKRKRDSEIQASSGTPVTRILRSMKNTVARILPRRSMRRMSKVL
ncbi:hypothetical protein HN51_010190 [Arachis hypogaea]|uniref:Uncharacterized protein n=2 Tax=Arachis hypogaea TaxID=3818 RepID=A0A445E3Y6_ARAHY|nr:uncharacterized protein LOC112788877 isoform X1 [Arachis hypogaea]XP_029151179.1 uncharacterized protein LOC112788877 isoform X1 [Arachis hypogaea]RYR70139.1 hypothetical protein Ahy_A03g016653 [Arachis hypogaea]